MAGPGQQLGRPLVELRCRAVREDDTPSLEDQETDVADLLNAWHVGHADWKFPRPDLFVDDGGDGFRPKLVVVGDSFWRLPDAIIATTGWPRERLLLLLQRVRARRGRERSECRPARGLHRG